MIWLDTQEKLDLVINALEDREIILDNRELTKEDKEEISREIAEYRAAHPKTPAKETVLV